MQSKYSEIVKFQLHQPKTQHNRNNQQHKYIQKHSTSQIIHSNCNPTLDNHSQYSQYLTASSIQNNQIPIQNVSNNNEQRYSLPNYNLKTDINQVIQTPLLNPKTHINQHSKSNQLTDTTLHSHQPIQTAINHQSPQTIANSPQDYTGQHKIYQIPQHIIRNLQNSQTSPIIVQVNGPKTNLQLQNLSDNPVKINHQPAFMQTPTILNSRQANRFCQSMIIPDKNLDIKYPNGNHTDIKLALYGHTGNSAYHHSSGNKAATATKSFGRFSNASNDSGFGSNVKNSSSQAFDMKSLRSADGVTNIKINGKTYAQAQMGNNKKFQQNGHFHSTVSNFANLRPNKKQQTTRRSSQYSINKNQSTGSLVKINNIKLSQPIHIRNDDFLKDVRKSIENLKVDEKPRNSPTAQIFPGPLPPTDSKFRKKNDGTTPQKDNTSHAPGFIQKKIKQPTPNIVPNIPSNVASNIAPNIASNIPSNIPSNVVPNVVSSPARTFTSNDFQIIEKLGRGTYGDVFLARERKTRFVCVLKALSKKKIKQLGLENHVFRQIKIQTYLVHKHITSLYGVFDDQNKIYLIMECVPDGSMQSNGKKKISQSEAAHLIKQTCQGLLYIHLENIIHRDIKPQNLLLNYTYLKIADFGCAVFGKTMRNTVVGSYVYISPEQFSNNPYDEKIDSWSVGILAYQMLTGKPPYEQKLRKIAMLGMNNSNTISNELKDRKISIEETMDFPEVQFPQNINISIDAIQFIRRLLDKDPATRADIKQALKHKFLIKAKQYQKYLQSQLQSKL